MTPTPVDLDTPMAGRSDAEGKARLDGRAHVLIADDDPELLSAMRIAFQRQGFDVTAAADGSAALAAFLARTPDLVVTDLIMPDMEGIETIRAMKALDPRVPIIAISGGGGGGGLFLSVAGALGAEVTVAKPFRLVDLLSIAGRILTRN